MAKYLYGAAVQGIQNFILETSKLREITGGSEFIEQVCTKYFREAFEGKFDEDNLMQAAAGIIRYVFDNEEDAKAIFRKFPASIQQHAPGITVSQAVVKVTDDITPDHISCLIKAIDEDRNRVQQSFLGVPMIVQRSPRNGQGATRISKKDGPISRQQDLKRKVADEQGHQDKKTTAWQYGKYRTLPQKMDVPFRSLPLHDLDEIAKAGGERDSWLAVVHADGNALGKMLIGVNELLNSTEEMRKNTQKFYKAFSAGLDNATTQAAQDAMNAVFGEKVAEWKSFEQEKGKLTWENTENKIKIPIRPVLLGGDDLTVIIEARKAFEFTTAFLESFEKHSKKEVYEKVLQNFFKDNKAFDEKFGHFSEGLTTCAGIAYIKPNYPFHYAEALAQKLCKAAKKASRKVADEMQTKRPPSGLHFHLVQSSFVDAEWSEIVARELILRSGDKKRILTAGPYLHKEAGKEGIKLEDLTQWLEVLTEGQKAPNRYEPLKAKLRALITEYELNPNGAAQYEARIREVIGKDKQKAVLEAVGISGESVFGVANTTEKDGKKETEYTTHIWDLIKLATVAEAKEKTQTAEPK